MEPSKNILPPNIMLRFFRWFCKRDFVEDIEGDLQEIFQRRVTASGTRKATWLFAWDVIKLFRPGIIRGIELEDALINKAMLKNYFVIATRVMLRQKVYSFINIFGLSIGLASSLLITIYILNEVSYDRFFSDADRIYRAGITERFQGEEIRYASTCAPLAEAIRREIPEVTDVTRVTNWNNLTVRYEQDAFIEDHVLVADANFFNLFDFEFIHGNPATALKGPNKILITESIARKYFNYHGAGDNSPLGKSLVLGSQNDMTVQVVGILKDVPQNTHLTFDFILSGESSDYFKENVNWASYGLYTYFKIQETSSLSAIQEKLASFVEKNIRPEIEAYFKVSLKELRKKGDDIFFFIDPVTSIHLQSDADYEIAAKGDIRYIYILGAVALLLVIIACINFMNLTTARAMQRAKEVGVRKTIGAGRSKLVIQFMMESFLYTLISSLLAIGIIALALEPFNLLTGKSLDLSVIGTKYIVVGIFGFIVIIGLMAGSYPSFYLTSFQPAAVLKGKLAKGNERVGFRNALVVFQFVISMALIISTFMIHEQVEFIQKQKLGFESEHILTIAQTSSLGKQHQAFRNALLEHPEFKNVSYASNLPPHIGSTLFIRPEGTEELFASYFFESDPDLLQALGFTMKSGRFFSPDFPSDSTAIILNETAAKLVNYTMYEGKQVSIGERKWNVIGIIKDFNFSNLKGEIQPLVITRSENAEMMALRLTPGDIVRKVALAESIWKKFTNGAPFQYSFIDDDFNSSFHAERKMGDIFLVFTMLAIFIACMGLFGLFTYTTEVRTKEIGIRKIVGASITQIMVLLSKDLVWIILLAFFIAVPLTWYGINQWLQSFPYHIHFNITVVVIAGALGIVMALISVSFQSYKAASCNPVKALKTE